MGNTLGVKKEPQEQGTNTAVVKAFKLLGIPQTATLKEVRTAYGKQSFLNRQNADTLLALNQALGTIQSVVPVEIYTNVRLESDYTGYASDFFERVALCYKLHPRLDFVDADFPQFYRYWNSFRIDDPLVEKQIRGIIKRIKAMDPRYLRKVEPKPVKAPRAAQPNAVPRDRTFKVYEIVCKACNKGFNSSNTFKDHIKSKKHQGNMKLWIERGEEENSAYAGQNGEYLQLDLQMSTNDLEDRSCNSTICESDISQDKHDKELVSQASRGTKSDDPEIDNIQLKKADPSNKEHEAFRTCFYCKEVLETRGKLILHIKSNHTG